jgi:hypothetical protein
MPPRCSATTRRSSTVSASGPGRPCTTTTTNPAGSERQATSCALTAAARPAPCCQPAGEHQPPEAPPHPHPLPPPAGAPTTEVLRFHSGFVSSFDCSTRNPKWVLEHLTLESSNGEGDRCALAQMLPCLLSRQGLVWVWAAGADPHHTLHTAPHCTTPRHAATPAQEAERVLRGQGHRGALQEPPRRLPGLWLRQGPPGALRPGRLAWPAWPACLGLQGTRSRAERRRAQPAGPAGAALPIGLAAAETHTHMQYRQPPDASAMPPWAAACCHRDCHGLGAAPNTTQRNTTQCNTTQQNPTQPDPTQPNPTQRRRPPPPTTRAPRRPWTTPSRSGGRSAGMHGSRLLKQRALGQAAAKCSAHCMRGARHVAWRLSWAMLLCACQGSLRSAWTVEWQARSPAAENPMLRGF